MAENEMEEEGRQVLGDVLEHAHYFEQANVGLGREETFRVFLATKQLSDAYAFEVCRFWGESIPSRVSELEEIVYA